MMTQYQVTLFSITGKYKPVSCIVNAESGMMATKELKLTLINQGMKKICQCRYWTSADIKKYGYLKAKVREYDKKKIEAEASAKYEALKEAKYQSGEWKRPKQ